MLIHLVRDNKCIISDRQFTDLHQLFSRKYLSARVGRVADDDRLCTILEALLDQFNVKPVFRRNERNIDRIRAG